MDDRRVMRDSRQERLMRRRGMNETSGSERVDEPVNRIPVHGIAVDGARRYHSGQRYPPRLYLVRGGGGGVRVAARNGATTSSVYGTSPVLRHNWNSMTATTRGRERRTGDGYSDGWTAGEGLERLAGDRRHLYDRIFFFAREEYRSGESSGGESITRLRLLSCTKYDRELSRRWMDGWMDGWLIRFGKLRSRIRRWIVDDFDDASIIL